jgi:urea transporter
LVRMPRPSSVYAIFTALFSLLSLLLEYNMEGAGAGVKGMRFCAHLL